MKHCSRCGKDKPLTEYHKNAARKDGVSTYCRSCMREYLKPYDAKRYADNKEAEQARNKDYRSKNKERIRIQDRASAKAWREANPAAKRKLNAARKQYVKLATTAWDAELDSLVIAEAYALADIRTAALGGSWHVDHLEPLRGRSVCGLHNAYNLQVVPATFNLRKNNACASRFIG